jgi:hypothetical protein
MSFRTSLLTIVYGIGIGLCWVQQIGQLPTDSPADLAPFPATSLTQASSGMTNSMRIEVNDMVTGQNQVGWWWLPGHHYGDSNRH